MELLQDVMNDNGEYKGSGNNFIKLCSPFLDPLSDMLVNFD